MSDCCDIPTHICLFPTELLICIFKFLSAKNLIICRQVCQRWKAVIDEVTNDDKLWENYCEQNYKSIYIDAMMKSQCRLWFDIYRSLTLWGRLCDAKESRDEFCHSAVCDDEIQDIVVIKNGIISVHKRASVAYYDLATLEMTERDPVYGQFSRFIEYDDATIILGNHLHLRIVKHKKQLNENESDMSDIESDIPPDSEETIFYNTKYFLAVEKNVYFVNLNNEVFHCDMNSLITEALLRDETDDIISLGISNGHLNILTAEKNIYTYQKDKFVKQFNLESHKNNIFDALYHFGILENIDWRLFYIWLTIFRVHIPQGPLKYICSLLIYGDTFFIGCNNGIVLIYHKPFVNGQLDFFSHKPVKQYNFSEREDIPVLSLQPILAIEVVEIKGGHKMLVATPKKVILVTYMHNFEVVKSKAVMPYIPPGPVVLKV